MTSFFSRNMFSTTDPTPGLPTKGKKYKFINLNTNITAGDNL
jgi:hypothetical protein